MRMKYDFKVAQELAWGVGIAALAFVLTAFVATDVGTDWRVWLPAVAIGATRAAAGAALALLTKRAL